MMKYPIIGRRAKELNSKASKYEELEKRYYKLQSKYDRYVAKHNDEMNDEKTKHKREVDALYTSLEDKDKTIEKLQSKIDILYEYHDMDKEPSQEIKTKMRINDRIHDLELENIELRNNVRMRDEVQKAALACTLWQARSNLSVSQTAFLPRAQQIAFIDAFGTPYYSY